MKRFFTTIILALALLVGGYSLCGAEESVFPPGTTENITKVSILIGSSGSSDIEEVGLSLGLKLLAGAKIFISGMALIYIVLIGVFMIVFSENEERIKSQRKQIIYVLIGFIFLNIPGLVYRIFYGGDLGSGGVDGEIGNGGNLLLWNEDQLIGGRGFVPMLIGFFEIFLFGVAILMFTWGFFRLIISAGNEEIQKKAKNGIIYGVLALLFLGFAKAWGAMIVRADFFGDVASVSRKLIGLALYFAAPIATAFLVYAAYIYITSAGDEERTKKAKSIFTNTLIAALILLGAYSFLLDLASFTL